MLHVQSPGEYSFLMWPWCIPCLPGMDLLQYGTWLEAPRTHKSQPFAQGIWMEA